MFKKILNSQSKSISSASLILAVSSLMSAVLGLLRDRLLAGTFGAGDKLDVYYSAFTVPDFIALILIFGAISAAVIPIFSGYLIKSKDEAWKYFSTLLNVFLPQQDQHLVPRRHVVLKKFYASLCALCQSPNRQAVPCP